jgi:hypothetical protein
VTFAGPDRRGYDHPLTSECDKKKPVRWGDVEHLSGAAVAKG